jgi:hypothetical protein
MSGWIRLHRRVCETKLWFSEPFTRAQAWIDLIALANYKEAVICVRGFYVEVKRGQVGRGVDAMSKRWQWSRSKVVNFLKYLEKEQQIEQQKSNVITLISIVNYETYQSEEQQNEQQKENRTTTEEQQKDTIKKNKKNKKEKNNIDIAVECLPFLELYGKKMIDDFVEYWSEKDTNGKSRWEKQDAFEVGRRLSTWKRNQSKFETEAKPAKNWK